MNSGEFRAEVERGRNRPSVAAARFRAANEAGRVVDLTPQPRKRTTRAAVVKARRRGLRAMASQIGGGDYLAGLRLLELRVLRKGRR